MPRRGIAGVKQFKSGNGVERPIDGVQGTCMFFEARLDDREYRTTGTEEACNHRCSGPESERGKAVKRDGLSVEDTMHASLI